MQLGLTRASIVFPITSFLERQGAPVERLLAKADLPEWALTDPEMLIPTSGTARLLAQAARQEGIANLGLLSGQAASIDTLGIFGRLIRRSRTLGAALETVVRNHPIFSSNGRMWLVSRGEHVEFCQAFSNNFDRSDEGWQQASHYVLMLMLEIIRLAAGPTWRPGEVHLQTREWAGVRDVEALADAHLAFEQPATSITLPWALLDKPLLQPRSKLGVSRESIEAWKASAPPEDFIESVAQVVEMLSWECYPDIRLTAQVLGTSVRTLQRHLAAAGLSHASLVDRTRFATATSLLEETDTKILDIALDLGYTDHAHFTRAFRRWAGCSPQEFRRKRNDSRSHSSGSSGVSG